ncbi:MAG: hypothetical protein EXX96DRAFT_618259 [Benjaminiella poitrasii]|nr:MAG: hypothetical protein EXX96DRAFT_618259 [Benjaminiella poitrasii]
MANDRVVPYNPFLSKRYKVLINVEICGSVKATKYINKYIYKGSDHSTIHIGDDNDEIQKYLKAARRLFEFPMHEEIYYCNSAAGERCYLRLLLTVIRNPKSFEDLHIVDGIPFNSFREACILLNLVEDDQEWAKRFTEAIKFKTHFCDDLNHTLEQNGFRSIFQHDDTAVFYDNEPALGYVLYLLDKSLSLSNKNITDFNLPNYVYDWISLGPAGTGKTFVYNTLCHYYRCQGKIVLCAAYSGIATLLLAGSRTFRTRFGIPLQIYEHSTSVGRTLKDVLVCNSLFDGIPVALDGDFAQILLVVPKGSRSNIVNDSFTKLSVIRPNLTKLNLTSNMRLYSINDANRERAILCAKNEDFDSINKIILYKLIGQKTTLFSADPVQSTVDKSPMANLPEEYLQTLNGSGLPP